MPRTKISGRIALTVHKLRDFFQNRRERAQTHLHVRNQKAWGPGTFEMTLPLIKSTNIESGMRVLEIGGGSGQIATTLAKHWNVSVVTLEPWTDGSEIRDIASKEGVGNQVLPMRLKAQKLPFADQTFDAVISIGSFEMVRDERPKVLSEIYRVARVGALIGIAEPMCWSEITPQDIASLDEEYNLQFQKCFRTIKWYSELFQTHGLAVTDARYFPESRKWWLKYRETANISEGEKNLILQDDDRWLALGIIAGRKE